MTRRERTEKLAKDCHCRYCDRSDDPRLKCADDIESAVDEIEQALREAAEEMRDKIAREVHRLYGARSAAEDKIRAIKIE